MTDGLLSLKWNNHKSTFFHVISNLKKKERYSDATLACNGEFYPVHKLVLSVCSDYFDSMLEITPCKHPVIVLRDVRKEDLESILSYMYLGSVSVPQCDLANLIKTAELLGIKGLAVPDDPEGEKSHSDESNLEYVELPKNGGSPFPKRRRREEKRQQRLSKSESKIDIEEIAMPLVKTELIEEEPRNEFDNFENIIFPQITSESPDVKGEVSDVKEQCVDPLIKDYHGRIESEMESTSVTPHPWHPQDVLSREFSMSDSFESTSSNIFSDTQGQESLQHPMRPLFKVSQVCSTTKNPDKSSCPNQCPLCVYSTESKSNMRRHLRLHTGMRPFKCPQCPFAATLKWNLKLHLRKHLNERQISFGSFNLKENNS